MNRNTSNLLLGLIQLLMMATIPAVSVAQTLESLTAGAKVRVRTVPPGKWRVGYIRSVDSSGITATTASPGENKTTADEATYSWTLPLASVSRLEVSRGRGSRAGRTIGGAVIGGLSIGVMLGAIGYMATRCTSCDSDGIGGLVGLVYGFPIGFVLGGITSFASARERWEPVSVPRTSGSPRQ